MSRLTVNYPRPPKKGRWPEEVKSNLTGTVTTGYVRDGRVFTYQPTLDLGTRRLSTLTGYSGPRPPFRYPPVIHDVTTLRVLEVHTLSELTLPGDASYKMEVQRFNPRGWSGLVSIDPSLEPNFESSVDADVNSRLLQKLLSSSVNIGQVIAEREQTIALVAKTARRLALAAFAFRKGSWAAGCAHLGYSPSRREKVRLKRAAVLGSKDQRLALANSVLELQYGIRPLLSDVFGAAQHLAERTYLNQERNIFQVQVTRSRKEVRSRYKSVTRTGVYTSARVTLPMTMVYTKTYRVTKRVYFRVSSPLARELNQLGLTNPASLAWETLPGSFVIDWLLPVGTWLANLTATTGLSFVAGMTTKEWDRDCRYFTSVSESKHAEHKYVRSTDSTFPVPSLPRVKNPASVEHMVNALALLQSAFFRK